MKHFINLYLPLIMIYICSVSLVWIIFMIDILNQLYVSLIFISIGIACYFIVSKIIKNIAKNDIAKSQNTASDTTDDEILIKQVASPIEDTIVHPAVTDELEQSKSESRTYYEEISIEKEVVNKLEDLLIPLNEKIQKMLDSLETTSIFRKQKENLEKSLDVYINGNNYWNLKNALDELISGYEVTSDFNKLIKQNSSSIDKDHLMSYTTSIFKSLQQGFQIAGIEQFYPEIGSLYETQFGVELVESIVTEDSSKIGVIAKTIRPGWITTLPYADDSKRKTIRKAKVSVYVVAK